jgi:hypothetical protein
VKNAWKFWQGDNGLSIFLLLLLLAVFLAPFTESEAVRMLASLLFSLVMVSGVADLSPKRWVRISAGMVACAAIVLRWMTHFHPTAAVLRWSAVLSFVFMVLLTVSIIYKVFLDDKPVTADRVRGAVAAYLLFGLTWSILYGVLDQVLPHAFNLPPGSNGTDRQEVLTYFSFVTLTTLGYGDITPAHDISRLFTIMEALTGQLYPATLLARLVSLEISHRNTPRTP